MEHYQSRVASAFKLTVWCVVVALMAGCGPKKPGLSILRTTIGDREVKASVEGGAFISSDGDTAILTFSGGKLLVEKGRIELAGRELVKIPEDSKKVEIGHTAGKLALTVDGEMVLPSDPQE